jgi:hypothetical protein
MVDSGTGRSDRPEVGQRRCEARTLAEPDDREVRQPRTPLGLVDAEPMEPALEVTRELPCGIVLVVEDEHPDAPRLPIAALAEQDRARSGCCCLELGPDPIDLAGRARSEKGKRDVQVVASDRSIRAGRKSRLPGDEAIEAVLGQREGAKEPHRVIAPDATSGSHARMSRSCDKRRRTRWSAATVARARIVSRSDGKLNWIP